MLHDMGECWYDDEMEPTFVYDENGKLKYSFYCPYIPKNLFDGAEQDSTDSV